MQVGKFISSIIRRDEMKRPVVNKETSVLTKLVLTSIGECLIAQKLNADNFKSVIADFDDNSIVVKIKF